MSRLIQLIKSNKIAFSFPYEEMVLSAIKGIGGATWNDKNKNWIINVSPANVSNIMRVVDTFRFDVTPAAECVMKDTATYADGLYALSKSPDLDIILEYTQRTKRLFIADEYLPFDSVVAIVNTLKIYPCLIVTINAHLLKWQQLFANKKKVTIVTYDKIIFIRNLQGVIFDCAHLFDGFGIDRIAEINELISWAEYRIMLSPCTLTIKPRKLLSQLKLLKRFNDLGGFWHYCFEYCGAYKQDNKWHMDASLNLAQLERVLRSTCLIARKKNQII